MRRALPSRATLAILPIQAEALQHISETGHEGMFVFKTGDFTAQVVADPTQLTYVAPAFASDGSAGVWVRQGSSSAGGASGGLSGLFTTMTTVDDTATAFDTVGYSTVGVGAARYIYDAAVTSITVAANPRTQKMFAARGFKLDPNQPLNVQMFGAVAGGNNATNGANNLAAINAAAELQPLSDRGIAPVINLPVGTFYVSDTLNIHQVQHWIGAGNGNNFGGVFGTMKATRIITPTDVTVLINHSSNTTEAGVLADVGAGETTGSAFGSIYEGISFEQQTKGTSATAYGVWMRGACQLIQCSVRNIASHGFYMYCTATAGGLLEGDCNNWYIDHCFAHTIGGHGLFIRGQDVNAGTSFQFTTAGNTITGCAIYDRSGLGCTHVNPQTTGYGNTGVFHLGSQYQLNDADGLGSTTEPGTNNAVWYLLRTGVSATATFPQWVSGAAYVNALPLYITAASTVVGGYQEFGNVLCHVPGAIVLSSNFRCTDISNAMSVRGLSGGGGGIVSQTGIGFYRSRRGQTNLPGYAAEGDYAYTMLGTKDLITGLVTDRANILEHGTEQDGTTARMAWHWSGKDQYLRYVNTKPMWSFGGPGTARTYGRDTIQPYYFTLHDYALIDPTNAGNLRIHGLRSTAYTTGNHARGEFVWSMTPGAAGGILGWSTTTGGTPGTQTPLRIYDQMAAQADTAGGATLATIIADHNALLAKLRTAGLMLP